LAAFVMVESEFLFQLAVVLLDPPARLGDAHEAPQRQPLLTELGQPIFRGLGLPWGELSDVAERVRTLGNALSR
jgi:hypothetical protein